MPCRSSRAWAHRLRCVLAAALVLLLARSAQAVVVYKKGASEPIAGYLVREDDREVVVRQPRGDGRFAEIVVPKQEIEDLLHTVDPARLSALDPTRPQEYREYADELAEKKLDPEARDLALRLYVIAAHVARGEVAERPAAGAHAPLLGLIPLARSPEEEARFRAAAYLADPRHDARWLVMTGAAASDAPQADPAGRQKLLEAVHHARRGKGDVAGRLIEQPAVASELEALSSIVSKEELHRICRAKELSDDQLAVLVKLELAVWAALSPVEAPASNVKDDVRSWSQVLKSPQPALRPLSLEHLTEFDPRQCLYRDGKWTEP